MKFILVVCGLIVKIRLWFRFMMLIIIRLEVFRFLVRLIKVIVEIMLIGFLIIRLV